MDSSEHTLRHLEDLYRRAEKQNTYLYSAFLTPAEQAAFLAAAPKGGIACRLEGGAAAAERRLIIFGSEEDFGYPPEPPLCVLSVRPASEKFAEALTHRDYLGAVLALGIERENVGDIIVREKEAYLRNAPMPAKRCRLSTAGPPKQEEHRQHHETLVHIIPALYRHPVESDTAFVAWRHQVLVVKTANGAEQGRKDNEVDPMVMFEVNSFLLPTTT